MNALKISVIFGVMTACVALTACSAHKSIAASPGPDADFQDVTNIVFSETVVEDGGTNGGLKNYDFTVSDPDEVRRLVSFMHLKPCGPDKCEHIFSVTFQRRSGSPIVMSFCSGTFEMVDDYRPGHYHSHYYEMPTKFYSEFRWLARRGFGRHWHPEQAP